MKRAAGRKDATPAGAYELQYRLEGTYRIHGWVLLVSGIVGFFLAIGFGDPWLFLFAGPAMGAGVWLLRNDPREYLVVQPRVRRLQVVRVHGKHRKVRRWFNLREFERLETAQYILRPKGLRCMIVLFRPDGTAAKVDDRIHEAQLVRLCADVAAAAELEFVDKGRVDA
ncbi:MAG: hypothetical protein HZB16_01070 [Armatimonadetes bacterium]|nr:hypothetical protein [Armatimonadota bacterium]